LSEVALEGTADRRSKTSSALATILIPGAVSKFNSALKLPSTYTWDAWSILSLALAGVLLVVGILHLVFAWQHLARNGAYAWCFLAAGRGSVEPAFAKPTE